MGTRKRLGDVWATVGIITHRPSEIRYVRRLARTIGRPPLATRLPWLCFSLVDFIRSNIGPGSTVFEFGGGGSTAWFADIGASVITVEHDSTWALQLNEALEKEASVTLLVKSAADDYREYVDAVRAYPDQSFDLVVVDGRQRVRCVAAAIPKVRPGGLLLLDDSERAKYAEVHDLLASWPSQVFVGLCPGKRTPGHSTVWRRP